MRPHPISPVSEPLQYRAIGLVRGVFEPQDNDQPTRGRLITSDGTNLEAVVLGRLLTLMRRHLDTSQPHLWVVYPRSRDDKSLHLQMMGVWEPSTLSRDETPGEPPPSDTLPEGDDYFSVRGELIYTRPESGDVVVKVRQLPRADGTRPTPFKLHLSGTIPLDHLRHFVSIDARRQEQMLTVDRYEVIAEVPQRGNRGGKARRNAGDNRAKRVDSRPGAGGPGPAGLAGPRSHGRAVSRPRP
ncbi:MAG: hypothetical protein ACKOPT_06175 [Cyanobium sp.]